MILCRTCLLTFDDVVGLCAYCDDEILSACRAKGHQIVSMECCQRVTDESILGTRQEIQETVECTECTSR
jgi:hypothetical protein